MFGWAKLVVLDIAVLIMYKWLLVGITVQEVTFNGEKPKSRIRSNVCSSMYM